MFRMQRKSASQLSILHSSQPIRFFAHTSGPSTSTRSHYEILGVSSKATQAEIKDAFFALSKKYHPDLNPNNKDAHERFVEINEAYNILSRPESRHAYDAKIQSPRPFGDRADTSRPHQWSAHDQQNDPINEMYRQYFEEFYRRQRRSASQEQSFWGQRQDSPFRDHRRDPPIWENFNSQKSQSRQDIRSRIKRDNQLISKIFRWYIIVIFATLFFQTLAQAFGIQRMHPPPPYGPVEPDPHLEERWRNSMAQDAPRYERSPNTPPSAHAVSGQPPPTPH